MKWFSFCLVPLQRRETGAAVACSWMQLLVIVQRVSPSGCRVHDLRAVPLTFQGAFHHWALLLQSIAGHDE